MRFIFCYIIYLSSVCKETDPGHVFRGPDYNFRSNYKPFNTVLFAEDIFERPYNKTIISNIKEKTA